eukprot:8723931-Alexandrium_andersonii.AAC.1
MSASLVGSEMCIRDSLPPSAQSPLPVLRWGLSHPSRHQFRQCTSVLRLLAPAGLRASLAMLRARPAE